MRFDSCALLICIAAVIFFIIVIPLAIKRDHERAVACAAAGGYYLPARDAHVCLNKEAVIKIPKVK